MKKHHFSKIFVLTAVCAAAHAYADGPSVYALVDGGIASSKISGGTTASKSEFVTGGVAPTFVGFGFDKTIDGLTVGLKLEQGFTLNSNSGNYYAFGNGDVLNRQKNIFIKGSSGSVVLGVQPNIAFSAVLNGDPRGASNFGSSIVLINGNGGLGTVDNASLSYSSPSLSGLSIAAQYVPQTKEATSSSPYNNGEIKTGSRYLVTYAKDAFSAGLAGYSNKLINAPGGTVGADLDLNGTIAYVTYKVGDLTLKGITSSQKSPTFTKALNTTGFGGSYAINGKTSVDLGVYTAKSDLNSFKLDVTGVGVYYDITKQLKFYTQYAVTDNKSGAGAAAAGWSYSGPSLMPGTISGGQKADVLNVGLIYSYF